MRSMPLPPLLLFLLLLHLPLSVLSACELFIGRCAVSRCLCRCGRQIYPKLLLRKSTESIARTEEGETMSMDDDSFYMKPRIIVMEMYSSCRIEHTFTSCFSCFPLFGSCVTAWPIIISFNIGKDRKHILFPTRKQKQMCFVWFDICRRALRSCVAKQLAFVGAHRAFVWTALTDDVEIRETKLKNIFHTTSPFCQ